MCIRDRVKLLRVLEEGLVRPLGGSQDITVNIRVISATHQNLRDLIAKNEFRKDLYYRLKVFELDLPPLRDRKEDIPSLAEHFMDIHNQKVGKNVKTISPSAMDILCNYDFPGNVRELQNIIERAVIITDGDTITTDSLPTEITKSNNIMSHNSTYKPQDYEELKAAKIEAQMDVERMFIIETLSKYNGNVSKAAHQVNMNRSWLAQLAKKHSIDPARFRIHV